jgi:hypothetical protein
MSRTSLARMRSFTRYCLVVVIAYSLSFFCTSTVYLLNRPAAGLARPDPPRRYSAILVDVLNISQLFLNVKLDQRQLVPPR